MRFRPCIDLHEGRVKQIVGGSLKDGESPTTNYESDRSAKEFARTYREDQLPGGHVIMLGKGNEQAATAALAAYPGGLHVGGGIAPDNALLYLHAGASHVVVTSHVFEGGKVDNDRLNAMVTAVGRDRLVLDLSCRRRGDDYVVVTDRWQTFTDVVVSRDTLARLAFSCDEFLVHGVDAEGLRTGVEEPLVEMLADWSPLPVTYAGGVAQFADLDRVRSLGKGRVDLTIGSALDLFGGDVPYRDVVAWQRREDEA